MMKLVGFFLSSYSSYSNSTTQGPTFPRKRIFFKRENQKLNCFYFVQTFFAQDQGLVLLLPSGADDGWILRDAGSSEGRHVLVGTGAGSVTEEYSSPLSVDRFHPHPILCGSRFILSRW